MKSSVWLLFGVLVFEAKRPLLSPFAGIDGLCRGHQAALISSRIDSLFRMLFGHFGVGFRYPTLYILTLILCATSARMSSSVSIRTQTILRSQCAIPKAAAGSHDSSYLLGEFRKMMGPGRISVDELDNVPLFPLWYSLVRSHAKQLDPIGVLPVRDPLLHITLPDQRERERSIPDFVERNLFPTSTNLFNPAQCRSKVALPESNCAVGRQRCLVILKEQRLLRLAKSFGLFRVGAHLCLEMKRLLLDLLEHFNALSVSRGIDQVEVGTLNVWVQNYCRTGVRVTSDFPHSLGIEREEFVLNGLWVPFTEVVAIKCAQANENSVRTETPADAVANLRTFVVNESADVFGHEVNENFARCLLQQRSDAIQVVAAPPCGVNEDERK